MRIGLVPGSFKPYHTGHDALVRIAAADNNDKVLVFYSTSSSRDGIPGAITSKIVNDYIVDTLPDNVMMIPTDPTKNPVASVYHELERAEEENSQDIYTIYSDSEDIKKYRQENLKKYVPSLVDNGQVFTRGIVRGIETPDISGTKMRQYIKMNDVKAFIEMLPPSIQQYGQEIFSILRNPLSESTLKTYIRQTIKNLL